MSGVYEVPLPFTAVTVAVDIAEVVAHATRPHVLLEVHLFQTSDVGDAQEEIVQLAIKTGQTTSGSGGNAATTGYSTDGGGASGFTFESFNTTKASAGTILTRRPIGWNIRGPLDLIFTELGQLIIPAAGRWTLELLNAPTDGLTIGGYLLVQELGS